MHRKTFSHLWIISALSMASCHTGTLDRGSMENSDKIRDIDKISSFVLLMKDGRIKKYSYANGIELYYSLHEQNSPGYKYIISAFGPLEIDVPKEILYNRQSIIMNADYSLSIFNSSIYDNNGIIENKIEIINKEDHRYEILKKKYNLNNPYDGSELY